MTARRGPARHAAGRMLPYGRRRAQDEFAEPELPEDDGYYPEAAEPHQGRRMDPVHQAEPAGQPEPVWRPEPVRWPEPEAVRRAEPQPVRRGEPVRRTEPVRRPEPVAGAETREAWLWAGRVQFDYLISHGLQPGDRMLEIGCGNLRAGHLFIDYLSAGNYYGIDTAPENLIAAHQVVTEFGLQDKMPHLSLFSDLRLGFLPTSRFTVVQAESVFAHSPVELIGEFLAHVSRVMSRDAIFDFTVDRAHGAGQKFRENLYHRTDTLIEIAGSCNLDAELLKDWEQSGQPYSKLRVSRRS